MKAINMKAINKYVITEEIKEEKKFALITKSQEEKVAKAKVVSVGQSVGQIKGVKKGDVVLFDRYISQEVEYNNKKYLIVNGEDLLAKIDG